jgi:hypothetical protein
VSCIDLRLEGKTVECLDVKKESIVGRSDTIEARMGRWCGCSWKDSDVDSVVDLIVDCLIQSSIGLMGAC